MNKTKRSHHNNIYFGDHTKLPKVKKSTVLDAAKFSARRAQTNTMPVRLYIAQHNFVDTEPSGTSTSSAVALPLLPGQAMDLATVAPALPTYIDFAEIPVYDSFLNVIVQAEVQGFIGIDYEHDVVYDEDTDAYFLLAFYRDNIRYGTITDSFNFLTPNPTPVPPATSVDVVGSEWTGWGVTYFAGIHRPQRFEVYPALAMNQYPIVPVIDTTTGLPIRTDFTLDFTKTLSVF